MRDVVDSAKFVFDGVRCPIPHPSGIQKIVMRHGSRPHDLRPRIVPVRIFQNLRNVSDNRFERGFAEAVGKINVLHVREIPLHDMCHNVCRTASDLVSRKRETRLRIEHRKFRVENLASDGTFQESLLIRNYGGMARFASRRRNGKNGSNWQGFGNRQLPEEKIPHVTVVFRSNRNGLRGVDNASPSYREHEFKTVFLAKGYALSNERNARIRLDSGKFHEFHSRVVQRFRYAIKQSGKFDSVRTVMEKDFFRVFRGFLANGIGDVFSENDFRRILKNEILHGYVG